MDGLAPGLGSVSGSPGPLCGHTSWLCLFRECYSCSFCWICLFGEELHPGMTQVTFWVGHDTVGVPMRWGDCLWDLSLGHRDGDENLMGRRFG
jgi:hypothetical protein